MIAHVYSMPGWGSMYGVSNNDIRCPRFKFSILLMIVDHDYYFYQKSDHYQIVPSNHVFFSVLSKFDAFEIDFAATLLRLGCVACSDRIRDLFEILTSTKQQTAKTKFQR